MISANRFLLLFLPATFCVATASFAAENKNSPRWDGTYIKAIYSEPSTLDPAQMNDTASLLFSNLLYDGLLSFSPDLEIQPALAKSWRIENEGKLLIFQLRENARFHDGTPIKAKDVVASFSRLIRPGSRVFSYYDCIAGAKAYFAGRTKTVPGLRVKGDLSVEIELEYPFPPFLSVLAGATAKVIPSKANTEPTFFTKPIGSGPFRYSSSNSSPIGSEFVLESFEGYYGNIARIKKLILKYLPTNEAIQLAKAQRIHDLASVAFVFNGDEPLFEKGQHFQIPVMQTWVIALNTRLAPFDNPVIRKAFVASFDSNDFRKRFYSSAIPANGYIPPGLPGFQWSYDKKLHEDASVRPVEAGEKIKLYIPIELIKAKEIAKYLMTNLRKAGFQVEVVLEQWPILWEGVNKRTLQASLFSMNIDYPDTEFLVRNFESTNPDNITGVNDRKADQLIRKARATPDKAIRQKLYVELVNLLNAKAVTINLFHPQEQYWLHPCVRGFRPNPLAELYIDYKNIFLDEECLGDLREAN